VSTLTVAAASPCQPAVRSSRTTHHRIHFTLGRDSWLDRYATEQAGHMLDPLLALGIRDYNLGHLRWRIVGPIRRASDEEFSRVCALLRHGCSGRCWIQGNACHRGSLLDFHSLALPRRSSCRTLDRIFDNAVDVHPSSAFLRFALQDHFIWILRLSISTELAQFLCLSACACSHSHRKATPYLPKRSWCWRSRKSAARSSRLCLASDFRHWSHPSQTD